MHRLVVLTFTLSKIFMDPVWYFYTFWFPEYLKNVRHFDLAAIGKFAWIPFAVAGFGNLLGGLLSGYLLRRGLSTTMARKSVVTFFALLMMSAIPAVLVKDAAQSIALVSVAMLGYTGCTANMLSMPGRFSQIGRGIRVRSGKHGRWVRGHAFRVDHWLGCGPLLLHARLHRLRTDAADLRADVVDAAWSAAGTRGAVGRIDDED